MTRTYVRKGDVFSVETDCGKRYFQYVCNDINQLNGNVICVFKDESLKEVDFYIHTTVAAGVKFYGWQKIGKLPCPDISDVVFFTKISDIERKVIHNDADVHWRVWTISGNAEYVKDLPDVKCYEGLVCPPCSIPQILCDEAQYNYKYFHFLI